MKLYIYDLVMFIDKKNGYTISLEPIHTMKNYVGVCICETNSFKFNESNLKVLNEHFRNLTTWTATYDNNIEIVGIWRFNKQTKEYKVVYYEN